MLSRVCGLLSIVATIALCTPTPAAATPVGAPPGMGWKRAEHSTPAAMGKKGWKPADQTKPVKKGERIPSSTLVMIAYLLIWGCLFGYLIWLGMQHRRVAKELAELRRRLPPKAAADAPTIEAKASAGTGLPRESEAT